MLKYLNHKFEGTKKNLYLLDKYYKYFYKIKSKY